MDVAGRQGGESPTRRAPSPVLSLSLAALIVYLAAHTVTGRHGLVSYMGLQEEERALMAQREALKAEARALDARARRLASARPDLDSLEEAARETIDAAHPDEIIFLISEAPRADEH